MKIQVRKSVFETNSSTCHTIAIPKRQIEKEEVTFFDIYPEYGESYCFERGLLRFVDRVGERIAYSYMAILYKLYHDTCMEIPESQWKQVNFSDIVLEKVKIWKDRILGWMEEYAENQEIIDTVQKMLMFLEAQVLDIPTSIDMFGKRASIDHPEELYKFVEDVKKTPELLEKFIFDPDSYATVCGDEWQGYYVRRVGFEYDYPGYHDETGEPTFGDKVQELKQDWSFWMSGEPE
jgi:hypothetical protein